MGKTPGFDGITAEHIKFAGEPLIDILVIIFRAIFENEYIPTYFRRGIQVPLYMGKNISTLDVNNYRGITILSNFNKLFEALIWNRIKGWWEDNAFVSRLQGACRSGVLCVHTAMTLQETIGHTSENNDKIYVLYLDVAKAFESIWINGLFYQLLNIGLKGKTLPLLFKSYTDFKFCVRI